MVKFLNRLFSKRKRKKIRKKIFLVLSIVFRVIKKKFFILILVILIYFSNIYSFPMYHHHSSSMKFQVDSYSKLYFSPYSKKSLEKNSPFNFDQQKKFIMGLHERDLNPSLKKPEKLMLEKPLFDERLLTDFIWDKEKILNPLDLKLPESVLDERLFILTDATWSDIGQGKIKFSPDSKFQKLPESIFDESCLTDASSDESDEDVERIRILCPFDSIDSKLIKSILDETRLLPELILDEHLLNKAPSDEERILYPFDLKLVESVVNESLLTKSTWKKIRQGKIEFPTDSELNKLSKSIMDERQLKDSTIEDIIKNCAIDEYLRGE